MELRPLKLEGSYEITLAPRRDERGYFMRAYDEAIFREHGLQTRWVQENQARSNQRHTIRGLHFQRPPYAETKLMRVVEGAILDVFVDLRKDSSTYGQWDSIELSVANQKIAYVPRGFGHGFCTLETPAVVLYKVDSNYTPEAEGSLRWNDPTLGISWPTDSPYISEKDRNAPLFADFESPF